MAYRLIFLIAFVLLNTGNVFAGTSTPSGGGTPTSGAYLGGVTGAGGTNEGGSQGVEGDEFTGAATYAVPIPIPPGRGGIEPKLILNYHSFRKNPNSWVGYGWELDLGSIVRVSDVGNIDYVNGTNFEYRFGGQAETLVLLEKNKNPSDYGVNDFPNAKADLYAAKIESSFNIFLHLVKGSADYGWCVIDKSGRKYFFGEGSASRDEKTEGSDLWIARWLLTRVVDTNSNLLSVSYGSDRLPAEIKYDDIMITFPKLPGTEVRYFPAFRQGFLGKDQVARLSHILISQKNSNSGYDRLQKIIFTYQDSYRNGVPLLKNILRYGKNDTTSLPPITMKYFEGSNDNISFAPKRGTWASETVSGVTNPGNLGENRMFFDVNGDGLSDQVMGFPTVGQIRVRKNHFNAFYGSENWADPFADYPAMSGSLNASEDGVQYLFTMDMNGDGLPDRVTRSFENDDYNSDTAYFVISFNTGSSWKSDFKLWKDPYKGVHPGAIDKEHGLVDMNGDGLVDRVVKDADAHGFRVYYNTGVGFKETYEFWADPLAVGAPDHPAVGLIREYDDNGLYVDIRDINGDGLPDRIYKIDIIRESRRSGWVSVPGFHVSMNLNGHRWAQPELITCQGGSAMCTEFNSSDLLGIVDPVSNAASKGYINDATHDLVDMNGDGYLDRIEGDAVDKNLKIYYYKGIAVGSDDVHFSTTPLEINDPVETGAGNVNTSGTFLQDINGDGYPDRVEVSDTNYNLYDLRSDAISYSDAFLEVMGDPQVSQPSNGLKELDNGQGFKTATEYLPSSWPWNPMGPTHTFLPTPLHLVHKLYVSDPTVPFGDTSHEANRHGNMRWLTYWYSGGNIFVRYAYKESSGNIIPYISRFNGFQRVVKHHIPMSGETWKAYQDVIKFHQGLGDVPIATENKFPYFDQAGYSHFALSGKMYNRILLEGDLIRKQLTYSWSVNKGPTTSLYTNIECTTPSCIVKLDSKETTLMEAQSTVANKVRTDYTYDGIGNVTKEAVYGNSLLYIETHNTYFPKADFGNLQIRDRMKTQEQKYAGTVYRKKEFKYDAKGNPAKDTFYSSPTGDTLEATRQFDQYGNIINVKGTDGVEKTIGYDTDHIFPMTESVTLPNGGGNLTVNREYLRLTGRPSREINPQDVGAQTIYDDFGRPIEERIVQAGGGLVIAGKYEYKYMDVSVDGTNLTLLKTSHYRLQPGFAETLSTLPAQITYTDGRSTVLQTCTLSERKNYRVVYSRRFQGGRLLKETEPIFASSCDFASTLPENLPVSTVEKDALGRPTSITRPAGDADSPTGNVTINYQLTSGGAPLKQITLPKDQHRTELYDAIGRLTEVTGSASDKVSFTYNPVGDVTKVQSGQTTLVTSVYDMLGRKKETTDADMGKWTYEYNEFGRLKLQTDAKGQKIEFTYDKLGRVTEKKFLSGNGQTEKREVYEYDAGENGYSVMKGELYRVLEYGADGSLTRSSRFSYDPLFRRMAKMSRLTPELGEFSQTFVNNTIGQVVTTEYNGSAEIGYNYNITGGLWKACDSTSCTGEKYYEVDPNTGYDAYGSLLEERFGNGVKSLYEYYSNSHRMLKKTVAMGTKTHTQKKYTYDEQSNVTSLLDQLGLVGSVSVSSATYDNTNRLTSANLGTNGTITTSFDALGNTLKNSTVYGDKTYLYESSRPHAVTKIHDEEFAYDNNGNMISDAFRTMEYNAANQLVKVVMKNGAEVSYDYDYNGSRVTKKVSTKDTYGKVVDYTVHYLGDAIEIKPLSDEVILHVYAGGQLVATKYVGRISDVMGGFGGGIGLPLPFVGEGWGEGALSALAIMLIAFILITMFPFPLPWRERARVRGIVYSPALRAVSIVLVVIILSVPPLALAGDAGVPLSVINDREYLIYHHGDHLGSLQLITEGKKFGRHSGITYPKGSVIQRFEYLPWGQEAFALNPNLTFDPRFTGQEYDIETGLYFYKARYYNPALGRFIQPDTVVSDPTDPQSYNRYSYVRNNPLKYVDPSGHDPIYIDVYIDDDPSVDDPADSRDNPTYTGPDAPSNAENKVGDSAVDDDTNLLDNTTNSDGNDYWGATDTLQTDFYNNDSLELNAFMEDKTPTFEYSGGQLEFDQEDDDFDLADWLDFSERGAEVAAGVSKGALTKGIFTGVGKAAGVASDVFYVGGPCGYYGGIIGGVAGGIWGGAKLGALFGTIVEPGLGTVIGVAIGAAIGGVAFGFAGSTVDKIYYPNAGKLY